MFKYGNGDYMLKKVKKYSLFLIMTVFFGLLNIDGVKAVGIGDFGGSGGGSYLGTGPGRFGSITNPKPNGDNNFPNKDNNPGVRISLVDENGDPITPEKYVDVLTFDVKYDSAYGTSVIKIGETMISNNPNNWFHDKAVIDKYIKVSKETIHTNSSCWSFISTCSPQTFTEEIHNMLRNNTDNLQTKVFNKLGIGDNTDYENTYLLIEPILVYSYCASYDDVNKSCNGTYTSYKYFYGTLNWYENGGGGFNSVGGTAWNVYTNSRRFFTINEKQINKLKMSDTAYETLAEKYGTIGTDVQGINLISLEGFGDNLFKYEVVAKNPNNTSCETKNTMKWYTKNKKTSEVAENISDYNKRYGILLKTEDDCGLYCLETMTVNLPSLVTNPILEGNNFNWFNSGGNLKITIKLKCRYLPTKNGESGSYQKCMSKKVTLDKDKVKLNYNTSGGVSLDYTDGISTKSIPLKFKEQETDGYKIEDYEKITPTCDSPRSCREEAANRVITITKKYELSNISNANFTIPTLNIVEGTTKDYDISIKFSDIKGTSKLFTGATNNTSTKKYSCKYTVKKPYCSYTADSSNYNPAVCEYSRQINEGSYNITMKKDVCTFKDYNIENDNSKQGVKLDVDLVNSDSSDCRLYCTEKIKTSFPSNIYFNIGIGSNFKWINHASNDYDKVKVTTELTCRYLPTKNDDQTYNKCKNAITKISSDKVKSQIDTNNKINLVYYYNNNNRDKKEIIELTKSTQDINVSQIPALSCNGKNCRASLINNPITITFTDEYKMEKDIYVSELNGFVYFNNDSINSPYDKLNAGILHDSRYMNGQRNIQLKIEKLGVTNSLDKKLELNSSEILNTPKDSNRNNGNTEMFTCVYTPSKGSCVCPPGTTYAGENPYLYIASNDRDTLTCAEAQKKVCNTPGLTPDPTPIPPSTPGDLKNLVIYRTIDLNNPFPGKNGDGRTPGQNWNSLELIENKITKTKNAYNETPIYKITLTPETIKQIREYNDNHDYLDYENLNCKDDRNACISSFLHETTTGTNTTSSVVEVSGTCSNITHNNFYTCLHYDDGTNNVY